jgi:hypothetical protein
VTVRDTLAGPRGPAEIGGDGLIGAGLPVDRSSLRVDSRAAVPERILSFWRPFCCPDLGTGAASESGPVDRSLRMDKAALAVLRVSQAAGDWAAGMSPLAAGVVVRALAVLWVPHADWRCTDTGGWGAADNAGPVAGVRPPHADCWRLAAAVLRETLLPLVPPNPRACTPTPPSTLFEPVAGLGRLTLGGVLSSSTHSDLDSAQSSRPAAFPGGDKGGGEGGGDGLSEPVQGELNPSQALVFFQPSETRTL